MALRAGRCQAFALFIRRAELKFLQRTVGGARRDRRQRCVVRGQVAHICFAHMRSDRSERRMRAFAFLVLLHRSDQIPRMLPSQVRNRRCRAFAIKPMTAFALGFRKSLAGRSIADLFSRIGLYAQCIPILQPISTTASSATAVAVNAERATAIVNGGFIASASNGKCISR